jgi:hypothetical protein
MTSILICRDAIEDSVLGNLALARAIGRNGSAVCIIFTGAALKALDSGTFAWSENFKSRDAQAGVIAAAEQADLPLGHRELDNRWSDVRALVETMSGERGIRLIACPLWSGLLGLEQRLAYLERIDESKLVDLLQNADTVIGGY